MKRHLTFWVFSFLFAFLVVGETSINVSEFLGFEAYKMSDGKTYAVIVPELGGRVMAYGFVDGENLIWNANPKPQQIAKGGFINWGGDKSLVGPHANWWSFANNLWPPKPSWMGDAHTAKVDGDRLITVSPVWEGFNLQTIREYSFTDEGELNIIQTFKKTEGEGREMTIWNVSQSQQPDEVYVLGNPDSIFKDSHIINNSRESLKSGANRRRHSDDNLRWKRVPKSFF